MMMKMMIQGVRGREEEVKEKQQSLSLIMFMKNFVLFQNVANIFFLFKNLF